LPAVAVSSQLSQSVYFISIVGLSVLLARPVYLVYSASQERSAQVVASGLEAMIDSMSPGTTVVTSLESYPGVLLSVSLSGTTVAASSETRRPRPRSGGSSRTRTCPRELPTASR